MVFLCFIPQHQDRKENGELVKPASRFIWLAAWAKHDIDKWCDSTPYTEKLWIFQLLCMSKKLQEKRRGGAHARHAVPKENNGFAGDAFLAVRLGKIPPEAAVAAAGSCWGQPH